MPVHSCRSSWDDESDCDSPIPSFQGPSVDQIMAGLGSLRNEGHITGGMLKLFLGSNVTQNLIKNMTGFCVFWDNLNISVLVFPLFMRSFPGPGNQSIPLIFPVLLLESDRNFQTRDGISDGGRSHWHGFKDSRIGLWSRFLFLA